LSFNSRVLNNHEISYSTTEKELLAVVFGVQTHRCFLYGRKFKVITDHAALKWLITVKNHQCARLTHWVLKVAEYDFEILHRPGKKHVNADVLSRHVVAAVRKHNESHAAAEADVEPQEEATLSKEVIKWAQGKDEFCQQISRALSEGKVLPYFWDQDATLYYRPSGASGEPKIVVPASLREQVIRQYHDPVFAGHQGGKRTLSSLQLYCYWPLMSKDIKNFIQRCTSCAKMKGGRTPLALLGELPETTGPMELTFLDICGSYPITWRGHRCLLTFIDHFTRYPEAISIPNQEAETVARALVTQVFTRHGCPQVLSSDRGTNFMSAVFQEMCKLLQVKWITSTAFNPKMQGKIERFHVRLNQTMSHVNKYGNDCDDYVDYALMVHRATPHSTTKFSPCFLLHGWDMRLPNTADLSARMKVPEEGLEAQDRVSSHIQALQVN
jgi:transposase InsO family protein